jgi:hypothetical protein
MGQMVVRPGFPVGGATIPTVHYMAPGHSGRPLLPLKSLGVSLLARPPMKFQMDRLFGALSTGKCDLK